MANKGLFASLKSLLPRADARNEEGAVAYQLPIKHALAQLAATGCFNGTFYAQADDQLATLLALVNQVDDNVFLAKLAVYSRERAFMKDMPAALLLVLSKRDRCTTGSSLGQQLATDECRGGCLNKQIRGKCVICRSRYVGGHHHEKKSIPSVRVKDVAVFSFSWSSFCIFSSCLSRQAFLSSSGGI